MLILIIIVLIVLYLYMRAEPLCSRCEYVYYPNKTAAINPFVYPYNGYMEPDIINAQESIKGLVHPNVPDHDVLTN